MIYKNILNAKQLEVIRKIKNLPKESYLAGGTALALQLGHRTSLDFDFYTKEDFNPEQLLGTFQNNFDEAKVESISKGTLILEVDDISFSIFHYPYNMIKPFVNFEGIDLASIEDILAMKVIAISMRGKRRDFVDAFYLLKKFSLEEAIKITIKKYPSYQPMVILKGLIYFKDAEKDDISRKIEIFDKNFSWEKAKAEIKEKVKKYQEGVVFT